MKVSVVTVCFNGAGAIDETVGSVLSQTYNDIEYIVVDGASTDGTLEHLCSYGTAITKLISEPDTGLYNAMNKALGLVQGDIVIFMNAGDVFASKTIVEQVARVFAANPTTMLVYGDWQAKFPDRVLPVRQPPKLTKWRLWLKAVCHQTIFARRVLFDRLGGFDECLRICADWDWTIRSVLAGGNKAVHLAEPVCHFRMGGVSSNRVGLQLERHILHRRYYTRSERFWLSMCEFFYKIVVRLRSWDFAPPRFMRRISQK